MKQPFLGEPSLTPCMGHVLHIPPVPLCHVRHLGPQFPPHLFVPAGLQVSFEGGLSLDEEEEGRNGDQQSPVQVPSLQGAFEFAPPPPPLFTNPTRALPTASPVGPWAPTAKT